MPFQPIKPKKIYEEIVEQLKAMINNGDFRPGDKLPAERDMAESLGVSRASVREALTALETMGILDIRPGEGTFVRSTNESETFEPLSLLLAFERNPEAQMMEVRRILETECAALAAVRSTPDDLAKMANCLLKMRNAESIPEGVEADLRFHFAIAEATKNNVLLRIMNTVSDLMHNTLRQARENLYADPNHGPRILQEHEAILTAIKEKRPDEAWAKMVEHINNIEDGINCASPLLPAEEK